MEIQSMDTYLNNLNRWNIAYRCEVVASQAHVSDVYLVEKAVFPEKMQDSLSDLEAFFANEEAHGFCSSSNSFVIELEKTLPIIFNCRKVVFVS